MDGIAETKEQEPTVSGPPSGESQQEIKNWQQRMLPLMSGLLVALAGFFFLASLYLIIDLKFKITDPPTVQREAVLEMLKKDEPNAKSAMLFCLEENVMARRYHQANLSLMARLWTRYLGFVTGMILSLVGAAFILGKMREMRSELSVQGALGKLNLSSHSPGLFMVAMGCILMLVTILNHPRIDVVDTPLYFSAVSATGVPVTKDRQPPPIALPLKTESALVPATTNTGGVAGAGADAIMDQMENTISLPTAKPEGSK